MAGAGLADLKRTYAKRRKNAFNAAVRGAKVGAMLITRPADVRWLTGFGGEDSFVVVNRTGGVLITDSRFQEQAPRQCPGLDIHVRQGPIFAAAAEVARKLRTKAIAVQAEVMPVGGAQTLTKLLGKAPVPISNIVGPLRAVKDNGEIRSITKAARVAQKAFRSLMDMGAKWWIGKTERHISAELEYRMRLEGAEKPSFETIVACGANASVPHHRPGSSRIRENSLVLIDWGAMVEGYCSDLTRVVFTGRIPPKLERVYQVVLQAQKVGISACRSGVSAAKVDESARDVITRAGYGEYFIHGLGHGIGLEVHEQPAVSRGVKKALRKGMVVTVEPGIYLPGVGGVRIEDDVLVTPEGPRVLTSLPKAIKAMVLR